MNKTHSDSSTQPNILSLLDFCKGFFILWIVEFHFTKGDGLGWQGVHPFIVLSGFGLTYACLTRTQMIPWQNWFVRRAERILPTYWLVCLLGFLLVVFVISDKSSSDYLPEALKMLFLEVSFLKTLSYQTMWSLQWFDHMWFVPLVISFYVIFPWLYKFLVAKDKVAENVLKLFAIAILFEFAYRFIAVYGFDGYPIGYENSLFGFAPLTPLNRWHESFPFQLQMPFGLFFARIGEFVLGMVGAVTLIYSPRQFKTIFSVPVAGAGLLLWGIGCVLVYVGWWGWIISDFSIALGLTLLSVNLAWFVQKRFSLLFSILTQLGIWSYYIYLTHNYFIYFNHAVKARLLSAGLALLQGLNPEWLVVVTNVLATGIIGGVILSFTWLLMKFDTSKLPKWMIQITIGRVLQSR